MQAGYAVGCAECGQSNPQHGLWCCQCGAPLSQPIGDETAVEPQYKSIRTAIELYGRVLEDLKGLDADGEVPNATYDTIANFYTERLGEKRSQKEAWQRAAAMRQYVRNARSLAHAIKPRLHDAVLSLEEGIKKFPDEKILHEMAEQIRSRIKQREQAARDAKTVRDLLATAKKSFQSANLAQAENCLKNALELAPQDQEVIATLAQVQQSLEEQRQRPPVSQPTSSLESPDQQIQKVLLLPESGTTPAPTTSGPGAQVRTSTEQQKQTPEPVAAEILHEASNALGTFGKEPAAPSFAEEEEIPSPTQRWVESASNWSKVLKPFLLDNVGWFIGVFLIIAGFIVLIATFWQNIEENQILAISLVGFSLAATTGLFFALAYFMRVKHPELETSSNVMLIIVALLIPLVFASASLTTLVPPAGQTSGMNSVAVILGVLYGLAAAGTSYIVSMLASGLFARKFYRIYARVLIGICSAMLLVPLLRWISPQPLAARVLLTLTQYATFAVLGYGVMRFNREFMKTVFLEKRLTAYFTFGTLVNAAVVAAVFLQIGATAGTSRGLVGLDHYGPFVMLLAAMIFHTDYYLKKATSDCRSFSSFTFIGYAVSFVAIAISTLPYFGGAFAVLGLGNSFNEIELTFLENFSCAQTLLLAIVIYAALVWYLESIPPLYLFLLALCGEYYVLVTQWFIKSFGPASCGLASLPLFMGVSGLAFYFMRWDRKRSERRLRLEGVAGVDAAADVETISRPRVVLPFQVVMWGLGATLLVITFWTRFAETISSPMLLSPAAWLGATFVAYAVYFFIATIIEKNRELIYAGALVATLAALFGWEQPASPASAVALAGLSLSFAGLACVGERFALKRDYRTALSDSGFAAALLVLGIVSCRHVFEFGHAGPYWFDLVGRLDGLALLLTAIALVGCARQYRSRLPMFGTVVAIVVAAPTLCAAGSFIACLAAEIIQRFVPSERAAAEDEGLKLLGRYSLPLKDRLPSLFAVPLSAGALPVSLLGLLISWSHILRGDFANSAILGAAVSALVLALLTRTYRFQWLLALSIVAGYFAAYSAIQKFVFSDWSLTDAVSGHLVVAAAISLLGWMLATGNSAWCEFWLRRVGEANEAPIRQRQLFYSSMLHHVTLAVATVTLAGLLVMSFGLLGDGRPLLPLAAALLLAIFFGLSGAVYRSKLGSYLSLTALAIASVSVVGVIHLSAGTVGTLLAALGLVMASVSAALWGKIGRTDPDGSRRVFPAPWERSPLPLAAAGLQLWLRPLAEFALLFAGVAFVHSSWFYAEGIRTGQTAIPTLFTFGLTSLTLLFCTRVYRIWGLYILAILNVCFAILAPALSRDLLGGQKLVDVVSGQLLLAAVLSASGWAIATAYSAWCNYRLTRATEQQESEIRQRRSYYAGLLHHVALALASLTIVLLFLVPGMARSGFDDTRYIYIIVGLILAGFFGISGATYRSRMQTYLCLIALCFPCYGLVEMFVEGGIRSPFGAALGTLAVVFVVISLQLLRLLQTSKQSHLEFGTGIAPTAWDRPPLPLYATGAELWARPLAQASILLGILAVGMAVIGWHEYEPPVWSLATVYLAGAVWLLGSGASRLGILDVLTRPIGVDGPAGQESMNRQQLADRQERVALYVLGIVTVFAAVHATAQTLFLSGGVSSEVISWHLLIAAGMSLVGWTIATSYSAWCNSRLARVANEEKAAVGDRLAMYAGWLHHVILAIATVDLIMLIGTTVQENVTGVPPAHFVAGLLLAVFFGLSGVIYQTKLSTYMALISLGVLAVDLAAVIPLPWQLGGATDAAALALLGLCMISIATGLWRAVEEPAVPSPRTSILPSPWVHPPLPYSESSVRQLWARPLAEFGMAFAGVAILLAGLRWQMQEWVPILASFYFSAAVLILAARLYRTPVLTYMATCILWASIYPLLLLMIPSAPYVHSGTALAGLSLALWGASFVVERKDRSMTQRQHPGVDADPFPLELVTVFERPLARCAGIFAVIAIAHSLFCWRFSGWEVSHGPLVAACMVGAFTLLLSARTMKITQWPSRARLFVYLGCAALAGGSLAVAESLPGFPSLGPVLGMVSFVLGFVGLVLIESAASVDRAKVGAGDLRRVYGEPMSHSALVLPLFAVLLAVVNLIPHVFNNITRLAEPAHLVSAELGSLAATLLIAAAVYLIATRAMRERRWLYPSVILGSLGILVFIGRVFIELHLPPGLFVGLFILTTVLLMNLLVLFAHWIQGNEGRVGSLLGISGVGCERPWYQWPSVVTAAIVLSQGVFFCLTLLRLASPLDPQWPWAVTPILACGLYLHLFYLERRREYVHVLVASSLLGCLGAVASFGWKPTPDIAVAILGLFWGIVAAGLASPRGDRVLQVMRLRMDGDERHTLSQSMAGWSAGLLVFAMIVTVLTWTQIDPGFPSTSLTLLLAAIGFVAGGYVWRRVELVGLAAVLLLASIWTVLVFDHGLLEVLPTAGLATIALSAAYVAISRRLMTRSTEENGTDAFARETGRSLEPPEVDWSAQTVADAFARATGRSLAQISAAFTVLAALGTLLSVLWLLPPSVPTAVTLGLICVCWLYMAWSFKIESLVYTAEAALVCALIYIRHGIFEAPFRPELVYAFGIVGVTFFLYGLNILAARGVAWGATVFVRPTYYSALLLPLALMVVTPLEDRAALSWVTFATASFYMLVARRDHALWATYLAAVLFNIAIYIWIPIAHETTGLLTLYVIPAALTVLIFAHLHRGDLNRHALSGIRLAASAAILAVSTFEVFSATDSLLNFVVVLFLSLTGAIVGVALRIRPFVYIGSGFLVINVLGQLGLQIHNQGGLVRAVILIAVGFAVVGMMIFFNVKREALLRRYRSFVRDPRWE